MTRQPGASRQDVARLFGADRLLELDVDRLGVADEHRHAHAGRCQLDLRVEDLLGLGDHLPFFLGRAVVHEGVDLGNDVEGDALRELLRLDRIGHEDGAGLREEFVHRLLARARDGLIGRDHHALDRGEVVQRLQRDDELGGRAVGIGDDVLLGEALGGRRR